MLKRLVPALLVLCAVLVVAASGGAVETTREPDARAPDADRRPVNPRQARLMDAREVAKVLGVSLEDALRRLDLQSDAIPAFDQQVRRHERQRYGGLYIQHEPEYRIVVLLTSGELSDIEGYLPELLRGLVVVRQVERTTAQLRWVHDRVARLRSLVPFASSTNVPENRVEVSFIAATPSEVEETTRALREAAAQAGEPLPDWVSIEGTVAPVEETNGEQPNFLLTHATVGSGFGLDAIVGGGLELDLDRGCVLLSGRAVIWPAGTTLTTDPPQLNLPGDLTARPGDTVTGGGGFVPAAGPRQSGSFDGDLDKALACATEAEVVVFWARGESMQVTPR
jgi:hypothetical protein